MGIASKQKKIECTHARLLGASGQRRCGLTLVELLVTISIIALLIAILFPSLSRLREQANRVKCAANLRQIGMAMQTYAGMEKNGGYPRTLFDGSATPATDYSNIGFSIGAEPVSSFTTIARGGPHGNSVGASFFLLLKTMDLSPETFICPSSNATRGFQTASVQDSSNFGGWNNTANLTDIHVPAGYAIPDCSYSYQNPFPSASALQAGFKWNNTISSDFAIAADVNPGKSGIAGRSGGVETVAPGAPQGADSNPPDTCQYWGNSSNHKFQGQNVLYGDGHVEFQTTCFCGPFRTGTLNYRDNIYTSTYGIHASTGIGGSALPNSSPQDTLDSSLQPSQVH